MKRGDLVTVVLQGDYGKPRPALILQSDLYSATQSVIVLPLTSTIVDAPFLRVTVEAGKESGLEKRSQIMVEKPHTLLRRKLGKTIGSVDYKTLRMVEYNLYKILSFDNKSAERPIL
jgi:mRNA interferase MazF